MKCYSFAQLKIKHYVFKKMHWQLAQSISNHFQIYETFQVEQHQLVSP